MKTQVITVTLELKEGQEPYNLIETPNKPYEALRYFFTDIDYVVKDIENIVK